MKTPITWVVTTWKWIGTQFGFPTANIFCDNKNIDSGTRRFNVVIHDETDTYYTGVWPYFPTEKLLEVHLLHFQGNLYNKKITLYPLYKIRKNQKFWNINALIAQINQDKKQAETKTVKVVTFGTFDKFHPGHEAYLSQAKKRWDKLITIIARDKTVLKVKGHSSTQNEKVRKSQVKKCPLVDKAILGNTTNKYAVFTDEEPDIVCLWYDQHSFEDGILPYCKKNTLTIPEIIRLESFHPEKFKSSLIK